MLDRYIRIEVILWFLNEVKRKKKNITFGKKTRISIQASGTGIIFGVTLFLINYYYFVFVRKIIHINIHIVFIKVLVNKQKR